MTVSIKDNFIDILFPIDISINSSGGPEFSTSINTNKFKKEFRNINWISPRRKYNVGYNLKNDKQINELIALFEICKGRGMSFRYKDWSDYIAEKTIIGIGDGSNNIFQLLKKYSFSGIESKRIITKPVINTTKIFIDDNLVSKGNFAIGKNTGIVTFSNPPKKNEVITASFEFHTQVRFDNDFLSIKKDGPQNYSVIELSLSEVCS